jgi:hypothetical protein
MDIYRKEIGWEESTGANSSELDPMTGSCMYVNDSSTSIKSGEFLDQLSDHQFSH